MVNRREISIQNFVNFNNLNIPKVPTIYLVLPLFLSNFISDYLEFISQRVFLDK
jgi:hypothetical protein